MFKLDTKNIVYFSHTEEDTKTSADDIPDNNIGQLLDVLCKLSMKEKTPDLDELESVLQSSLKTENEKKESESEENQNQDGSSSFVELLQQKGYLKQDNHWLTKKGFNVIGLKILKDALRDLEPDQFGFHETRFRGDGNVLMDITKKVELESDVRLLSVSNTLLNSIKRISKTSTVKFPINIKYDDLEEFEQLEDVKNAIVYCIDLSSTMKYSIEKGISRIETAKRALWSLYVLNKKFFSNDLIFVVGFASMASLVNPIDIPYLKTFDANDNFLHYTNYQAALRLARKTLQQTIAENKRIVLITDGQPSACFVENEYQKNEIISEKPYSNFYFPDSKLVSKIQKEKNLKLDITPSNLVYLCYRYKKVDPKIDHRTTLEARKCKKAGIEIDSIVISDEEELLDYIKKFEQNLKGTTYHIDHANMDKVLIFDYLSKIRKVLRPAQNL